MKRISECAALSKVYTNHSVRATAITIMYQCGVDTKQICKVTKHKSEESLKHYIDGQSSAQKRQCSNVLSSAFSIGQPSASTSAPSAPTSATYNIGSFTNTVYHQQCYYSKSFCSNLKHSDFFLYKEEF